MHKERQEFDVNRVKQPRKEISTVREKQIQNLNQLQLQPPVPVQPTCPPEGTWNGTSCVKPLKCLPTQGTNGTFSDGVQTYNGSTWETTTPCTLNCNSGFVKKTGTD